MNVILKGIVGSTAYGLATPTSDIDRIGIFQLPTAEILGRWGKGEHHADSKVTKDPDVQLHELAKYIRLAVEANPTATELLWLDEFETVTAAGALLVDNRESFLSQRARARYVGYANSQVERLLRRDGNFSSDLKKRTAKHGRHCARLLIQARHILEDHYLTVKLTPDEATRCFELGELAEKDPEGFAEKMRPHIDALYQAPSTLREEPDVDRVRELLVDIRLDFGGLAR